MEYIEADSTEHIEAEGMDTEAESHSRYLQVEHIEVEGMDTEAEGMEHMSQEAEGMDHMALDLVRRRGIMLGVAAKNLHRSDDVSERNQLGE